MAKKSTTTPLIIEQVFYGVIDGDQVAIYRAKIGGEWVYNLTAKDLRTYNAIDTKCYQAFDKIFYDRTSYQRIQSSEQWFDDFDDALDALMDRNCLLGYDIHLHPDFRTRFLQEIEFHLELTRENWERAL